MTLASVGGKLTLTGDNLANNLTVRATADNQVQVLNGVGAGAQVYLGTYSLTGPLSIRMGNNADTVTVALQAFTLPSNVQADLGNGADSFSITGAGGTLAGGLAVAAGLGNDAIRLNAAGTGTLRVAGSVAVTDTAGSNNLTFGNGTATTTVDGDLSVVGIARVILDQGRNDQVGGSVAVSLGNGTGPLYLTQGNLGGSETLTVGKNFAITGGAASDDVSLRGLVVGGTLNVNLDDAAGNNPVFSNFQGNRLAVSSSGASFTQVNGGLSYTGGTGSDSVDLRGGVFQGNVNVALGDGFGAVQLASFGSQTTVISGDLAVSSGNGDVVTGSNGGVGASPNTAVIGGSVAFNLGNGNHSVSFDQGGFIGGTISYRSGAGDNRLLFAGSQTYLVDVRFGAGNDEIRLNNAAATLTGLINGGAGTDTLTLTAGTLGSPFTLLNF